MVSLFRILRDPAQAARLIGMLRLTPFSRADFEAAYTISSDPFERAYQLVVRSFMGFSSDGIKASVKTGFRKSSSRSHTTPAHDWAGYPDCLAAIVTRLAAGRDRRYGRWCAPPHRGALDQSCGGCRAESGRTVRGGPMTQNTSSAVMQQRHEPHESLDDFPTHPWATRAFMEHVFIPRWGRPVGKSVWEPASNRGFMARPLAEYFSIVRSSDVHDYGVAPDTNGCPFIHDFLFPGTPPIIGPDWIITNPPFRLGADFARRGLEIAREGVALFVRTAFTEGVERYNTLYCPHPMALKAEYAERVPLVKGRCDPKASTATAYSWVVWRKGEEDTRFTIIPPCRKELTRPGDYDEAAS